MKTNVLLSGLAFLLLGSVGFSQKLERGQVPANVLSSFESKHAEVKDVEWEKDGANFKVEFEHKNSDNDHVIWYGADGKIVKHKAEISLTELPAKISEKLKADYKDYKTDELYKIEDGTSVKYKVKLKGASEEIKVLFDENGNVLKS